MKMEFQLGMKWTLLELRSHDHFFFFIRYFLHLHFKCYPQNPLYPPPALLPKPPTPVSWPWHSPVLGHMIFTRTRASLPNDGQLDHPLLHMQLETQLWGVLVSSYYCSSYRAATTLQLLGYFTYINKKYKWKKTCYSPPKKKGKRKRKAKKSPKAQYVQV